MYTPEEITTTVPSTEFSICINRLLGMRLVASGYLKLLFGIFNLVVIIFVFGLIKEFGDFKADVNQRFNDVSDTDGELLRKLKKNYQTLSDQVDVQSSKIDAISKQVNERQTIIEDTVKNLKQLDADMNENKKKVEKVDSDVNKLYADFYHKIRNCSTNTSNNSWFTIFILFCYILLI